jgi:hypothetical protein
LLLQFNQKSTAEERDPEIHQTKKGNQWYYPCAEGCAYGMKVHNRYAEAKGYGVDKGTGLNHSVETWASPDFVDTDQGFTGVSVRAVMNACS